MRQLGLMRRSGACAARMSAAGLVLWVDDEELLHAVTAISGSAPAYFFYMLENMIATGEKLGLQNPSNGFGDTNGWAQRKWH